ncbi:hypothetical protein Intca_1007 [Intrasporangium calvum DSM 43043]|uniref:Uncharacterized protein n=2 Tax=Intrasporangium calvum TaxID=53358 RepID=E6SDA9_INTC7|nr:hypothetical protein Intca_1007 [Intrasporangium calvum DSM 43043]AXG12732.1 hypothetical protein DN585_04235 [Intrasporangium calvum]
MVMARILRWAAVTLTALFVVGGLLFAIGSVWDDPGGWTALLVTLAIVVPLIVLTVLAAREAELGFLVLAGAVGLFAAWMVLTLFVEVGRVPDIPVIALLLALPSAVLGRRHAGRAGSLLLALAAVPFADVLARWFGERGPDGPGLGALLGGSTGAVVVPLAVLAVLFLVAGAVGHDGTRVPAGPRVKPPARSRQHL